MTEKKRKIQCTLCEKYFKTQQGIKDHVADKHGIQLNLLEENDLDRIEADAEWANSQATIEEEQSFGA